jgi:hypothetical protein
MLQTVEPNAILQSILHARARRKVIYMLTVYGDESYDGKAKTVFVVAGLFGNQAQWDSLEVKWLARLGGLRFHAADCESDLGDFGPPRTHAENLDLYRDLTTLLGTSGILGYGVAMDLVSRDRYMKNPMPEGEYYRCFANVVVNFAEKAHLSIPQEKVKFVFEQRAETQRNAASLYDYMRRQPEWEHRYCMYDEVGFATKETTGLQVADLWARELMKHMLRMVDPENPPKRLSYQALERTGRFLPELLRGEYFNGLQERIEALDNQPGDGAFKNSAYSKWRDANSETDHYGARIRYLVWYDAMQRAKGGPTHFNDVCEGRSL